MTQFSALVTATYRRRIRVQLSDGASADARIKGRKLRPVCGDTVTVEPLPDDDELLITAIGKRRNELTRTDTRGNREVLATNLDTLAVVAAAIPKPDWFVVDRYLCAAELMGIGGIVVYNKCDLETAPETQQELENYESLGYSAVQTSAKTGVNIESLRQCIGRRLTIIVGQSGVGKSTLINALADDELLKTAAVSRKHREGRHTTVTSSMIRLDGGGTVIDSPGVRDYAPMLESFQDVQQGFREIRDVAEQCRFADCRHLQEPGCAVKAAVDAGSLRARRYESFRRAVFLSEKIVRGRYR